MRVQIQLGIEELPQHYRMTLLAFIKEMLRRGDEELYAQLYDGQKKPKKLTYSLYMKNFQLTNGHYKMDGATLTFSSSDPRIAVAFINGLTTTRLSFKDNSLKIQSFNLLNEPAVISHRETFKILNGLLVENANKKPLLIHDENFEKELNFIIEKQFEYLYGRKPHEPIQILSHQLKKIVVQESNRHAKGKVFFYTGQKGEFQLQGHAEDLMLLLQDGIGLRSASGWGTLAYVDDRRAEVD